MPDGLLSDADLGIGEAPAPPAGGSAPALLSDSDLGIGAPAAAPAPSPGWGNWAERGVRGIPGEIAKTAGESWDAIKQGLVPGSIEHDQSSFLAPPTSLLRTGKALAAIPSLIASPLTGAVKSFGGQGLAAAEHGIGSVIAPDVAARDDPQKMYEQAAQDVDTALGALAARGFRGVRGVLGAGAPEAVPPRGASVPEEPVPLTGPVTPPVATPRENLGISLLPPEAPHVPPPEATGARRSVGAAATPDTGPLAEISPGTRTKLKEIMQEEGFTPHTLEQRLDEMSQHEFFGELSDNTRQLMTGLQTKPGPGVNEIKSSVRERAREAPARMGAALDQAFGANENRAQLARLMQIERDKEVTPFWQQFRSTSITPTPQIAALMPRLEAAGALRAANRALQIEGLPTEAGFDWLPGAHGEVGGSFLRRDPRITSGGVQAEPQRVPTASAFQAAKEHLDDGIEHALAQPGGENEARRLTQLKNDLVKAIDEHPDSKVAGIWKQARDAYATPTAVLKAMKLGERVLTANIHADELPFLTASYSPAEMRAFNIGMRGHLEDIAGRPGKTERQVINKVLAPSNQAKIRWSVGDQKAGALIGAIEHEQRMHEAPNQLIHNSATAGRLKASEFWEPPQGLLSDVSLGDVVHGARHPLMTAAKAGAKFGFARRASKEAAKYDKMREEASRIFTLQGEERNSVARALIGSEEGPGGAGRSVGAAATSPQTYGQAIRAGVDPAQAAAAAQATNQQPLTRKVLERNRAGRPIRSERLAIGKEKDVLDAAFKRATGSNLRRAPLSETEEANPMVGLRNAVEKANPMVDATIVRKNREADQRFVARKKAEYNTPERWASRIAASIADFTPEQLARREQWLRDHPIRRATGGRVEPNNINHSPTESQKAAGNYAKDHVRIHGLDLTIENPKGGERKGTDRNGKPWSVKLPAHYGYIKRTEGADGDHVDVYLGPHKRSPHVFVIDQVNADSKAFDEHKAFIGFASKKQVERTYHKAFSDGRGPERLGHLHEMSIGAFKDWLKNGDTTKPIGRADDGR